MAKRYKMDKALVKKFIIFGIVGGAGAVINTALLWLLTQAGLHYVVASVIATEVAIVSNFFGNHLFTFRNHRHGTLSKKFLTFQLVSIVSLVLTVTILWLLTTAFGEKYLLVWNLIAILIASLSNFLLNLKFTWGNKTKRVLNGVHS
jgi:putative flippase GtrA